MFQGIKNGWDLIKESIKVFNNHPKFIVPLLITWVIYTPMVLYLKYGLNWDAYTTSQVLVIVFGVILIFAFLLAFSCSMLLELIQQLETGEQMNLLKAFANTVGKNIIKILPLVLVWAVIWFVLTVLQALLSKKRSSEKESFTAENAAKTLAGYQSFSISRAFFEALRKGVRMVMFLILPAIAWENLGFWKATKKGIAVFKAHLSEFVTGFVLTEGVALLIFLLPALLFYITGEMKITLPDYVWVITIVYIAFLELLHLFRTDVYRRIVFMEYEVGKGSCELKQKGSRFLQCERFLGHQY